MRATVGNLAQLDLHRREIEALINAGKSVNLSYDIAAKPKTKKQVGFFFAALVSQITAYLRHCGFNLDERSVRYGLYRQVAEVEPSMTLDISLFGGEPIPKHISDMETAEEMSKFISGVFTVIDTNPLYMGLQLTPDTRYCYINALTQEDLDYARRADLPERDEAYLNWVRGLPCIICGNQHRSHAHHAKIAGMVALAKKTPDWTAIPLCPEHHLAGAHKFGQEWVEKNMRWLTIPFVDFCRINYLRWLAHK